LVCLVSVLWVVFLYDFAFGGGGGFNSFIGNIGLFKDIARDSMVGTIPESLFAMFQLTFAIITPALIVGGFAERMRFSSMILFSMLWMIFVYAPITHMVWGGGFLGAMGLMDFAGGTVVHINAGVAALVAAVVMRERKGFPTTPMAPHNLPMTVAGASMLWVGWFGFNAGSALGANGGAGMAMLVTHISAATASLVWMFIEWKRFGKPSLIGVVTGMVAGLATVTPASGYIGIPGGLILGFSGGLLCYLAVDYIRGKLLIDDSLDVFAVHCVGGISGTLLVAFLATTTFSGLGLPEGQTTLSQFVVQIKAVILTVIWTSIFTYLILKVISLIVPLRVDEQEEIEGLDLRSHGEKGYHSD
jgi:Amt family ammonium transporter